MVTKKSTGRKPAKKATAKNTKAKAPLPFVKNVRSAAAMTLPNKPGARFTGKQLVILNKESTIRNFVKSASNMSMRIASLGDYKGHSDNVVDTALKEADGLVFEKLKVAVVNKETQPQMGAMSLSSAGKKNIIRTEPERFVYALPAVTPSSFIDDTNSTWGLQATNTINSIAPGKTGKGIRIAILDTGISMTHPDFTNRIKGSKSFVKNSPVEDGNGHGSHCAGIAAGKIRSGTSLRYGVATEADLYIAKVLSNQGRGTDSVILAAIEWAIENKCQIVSMSLGSTVDPGDTYYESYETAAIEALKNNCLLIAAAGNDSDRPQMISPVNHPANCPSIMAVASVSPAMGISYFSCGGTKLGNVDLAAPGENIFSSWKNGKYKIESGTSMATPFVAGIAALLCEKYPTYSMKRIWTKLISTTKALKLKKSDIGAGLAYFK